VSELCFCIPVFNDWSAVARVLAALDGVAADLADSVSVLLVDDGSTEPVPSALPFRPAAIRRIHVLPLRRNLGHQRAIAIGLSFVYSEWPCRAVVVMDADGEDAPADVPRLLAELAAHDSSRAVFAARARRSEGLRFWLGYRAYKVLHRVLTGRRVEVGNFSVLPWHLLERLVGVSEVWNHYAAAVHKARFPVAQVRVPRAKRLAGESRMNFVALVTHGLSAISVYGEVVGVRLLCLAAALTALALAGILATLGIRLFTTEAIPGWATTLTGLLSLLVVGLATMLMLAVLFVLQSRERSSFLPLRDFRHYVLPERVLFG
jgi:glycosyltransferase involved in cell wall biosynthesis